MKKVLFADDREDFRYLVPALLRSWDYEVVVATDEDMATVLLETIAPGIVITDLNMKAEDGGLKVLVKSKALYPDVPVVVSSGDFDEIEGMRAKLEEHGADLLFPKPYKPDELKAALDSLGPPTMRYVLAWFLKTAGEIPSTEYCDEWMAATRNLNGCLRTAFGDNPLDQSSETELDPASHKAFLALKEVAKKWEGK